MPGSLETERIKHLPILKSHKELNSLERKRRKKEKRLERLERRNNSLQEIKMKDTKKGPYTFFIAAGKIINNLNEFAEGKVPSNAKEI